MPQPRYANPLADMQPHVQRRHAGAHGVDPPDDFMARNDRQMRVRQFAVNHMQIGAANATRQHLYAHFARPRHAIRQVHPFQLLVMLPQDHRLHVAPSCMNSEVAGFVETPFRFV
jgi:hypothetical protein